MLAILRRIFQVFLPPPTADGPIGAVRSPKWPAFRKRWLAQHPACAVCGSITAVVPHHIKPVHLFPEHELDEANLISLCEGSVVNCHLLVGHLLRWSSYNTRVVEDAAYWAQAIRQRP